MNRWVTAQPLARTAPLKAHYVERQLVGGRLRMACGLIWNPAIRNIREAGDTPRHSQCQEWVDRHGGQDA